MTNSQKWLVTFLDAKGGTALTREGTEEGIIEGFLDFCRSEGTEPEMFKSPEGKILLRVDGEPFALIEQIEIQ